MKTIRLHSPGDIRIHEEPMPAPGTGEALLKVSAVGICGSDLHWFSEGAIGDAQLDQPLILGHEFAGKTEGGQRVAVDPAIPCLQCEFCSRGDTNLCPEVIFAGHGSQDGAMREWMTWPEKFLFPIPDTISDTDGVMLEPLGVALHSIDLAKIQPGMSVGVYGCGTIGLLIVQLARLAGVKQIFATDRLSHRVEAAQSMGAHRSLLSEDGAEGEIILSETGGQGVNIAFEAAGEQAAVDTAITTAAPGGKVILAGIPDDDQTFFSASTARRKGLTIRLVRRMKHTYPRAIELVTKGLVDVRSLVTHRFSLDQAPEAFALAQRREGIKVIIEL